MIRLVDLHQVIEVNGQRHALARDLAQVMKMDFVVTIGGTRVDPELLTIAAPAIADELRRRIADKVHQLQALGVTC